MSHVVLVCGDGAEVMIQRHYVKSWSLFNGPGAPENRYVLVCKASQDVVDMVVDRAYDAGCEVDLTETNFRELRALCNELGFHGLDKELDEFEAEHGTGGGQATDPALRAEVKKLRDEVETLRSVTKQQAALLAELQRKVESLEKRPLQGQGGAVSSKVERDIRSLENRISDVAEEARKAVDLAQQTKNESVKRSEFEKLSGEVKEIKMRDGGRTTPLPQPTKPTPSPATGTTKPPPPAPPTKPEEPTGVDGKGPESLPFRERLRLAKENANKALSGA